jgi:uncharacterized protein (TIGR03000 family)
VVTAYSVLEAGGLLALAMEYVPGQNLYELVKARGPLPVANACYYAQQAALGLQHAYEKGMVHRDIKPHNLILAREGRRHLVKVLDFGLAKATREGVPDSGLTGAGQVLGTPDFMAPEQTVNAAGADIRADIYGLGCTLYFLLTGSPPFQGRSLYEVFQAHHTAEARPLDEARPGVPRELAAVVARMMAKDPSDRYQTPAEVARALAPFFKPAEKGTAPESKETPGIEVEAGPADRRSAGTGPEILCAVAADTPGVETTGGGMTVPDGNPERAEGTGGRPPTLPRPSPVKLWPLFAALALCAALLAVFLVPGVFRVKTQHGTIVLEGLPADAEVAVDGETVTVTPAGGEPAEIRVAAGQRKLEVRKPGFKVEAAELTVTAGERTRYHVRPEPLAAAAPSATRGSGTRATPATVRVRLPADAVLTFDGTPTTHTGSIRLLSTPPLEAARDYRYPVRATWTEDGRKVSRDRDVTVRAGERVTVDFTSPARAPAVSGPSTPAARPPSTPGRAGGAADDAEKVSLFNGNDLAGWVGRDFRPAAWKVDGGILEVVPGRGDIRTSKRFGPDFQLHAEFNVPLEANQRGQARGNSGIFLLGRYEIHILDSFKNPTPAGGACAALFGVIGPARNVSRPPGEWQTFDITFRAPRRGPDKKVQPGEVTVVHNGFVVVDKGRFDSPTRGAPFANVGTDGPIVLQEHGSAVRFRNLWLKPLAPPASP